MLLLLLLLSIRGMGVVWGYPGFLQRPATGKHLVIEPRAAIVEQLLVMNVKLNS